ncbi:putative inactive receptor kinase [Forsythia ovata]|uniref:Inactive receptor kinase n=1 Tax=Forsythia ovata TaxID=205694 RepID=A0ABD1X9P5_9LAMI
MSTIYDNWDRLVGAVIRREQLWKMFHDQSPSVSSASSDFSLDSPLHDFPRGSSSYHQGIENSQIKEQSVTKKLPQLVFFDVFNPAFDFDDILKSPAEFLGKGTFGSTYSVVIESGITIVVKRLKEVNIPEKMFRQHMEVIGNVRHENVSPLRAYYFSQDEKLMLYDHYSNGSISAMLHGTLNTMALFLVPALFIHERIPHKLSLNGVAATLALMLIIHGLWDYVIS